MIQRLSKCHDSAGRAPVAPPQDCQVPFAGDVFISRSATSRRLFHFRREKQRQMANFHKENSLDSMNAFSSPPSTPTPLPRDLIKKFLVIDRARRLGCMKVSLSDCFFLSHMSSLGCFLCISSSGTQQSGSTWFYSFTCRHFIDCVFWTFIVPCILHEGRPGGGKGVV